MDGMTRLGGPVAGPRLRGPVAGPRLGGPPVTPTTTGYPWVDGDILYAADLNAAFNMVGGNVSQDVGRNLLHNSLFNVTQRGNGPWTTGYTLDRWSTVSVGGTIQVTVAALDISESDRAGILGGNTARLLMRD